MMRMVAALEMAGHECTLLLYDPFASDVAERTEIIRSGWPSVAARVRSLEGHSETYDAAIATAWQTAHALGRWSDGLPLQRLYFIQDFEPFFYPRGAEYSLAEQSYRFGFTMLALGEMIQRTLKAECDCDSEVIPFGCDVQTYSDLGLPGRSGIVYYSMLGVARRGFLIAREALTRFHRTHPDQTIHVYGDGHPRDFPFPVAWHGRCSPTQLNELYNGTLAGLALSFTNISLVPEEMRPPGVSRCALRLSVFVDGAEGPSCAMEFALA